jgi:hypothetical protein
MAVGAQEDALARLGTNGLERPSQSAVSEPEILRRTITVMELQRADVAVLAAQVAAATGIRHKDLLQLPPSSRNRL